MRLITHYSKHIDNAPKLDMTTAFNQAFRLYSQYKTQTAQYRALATQLGHTVGSLNAAMSAETYRRSRA